MKSNFKGLSDGGFMLCGGGVGFCFAVVGGGGGSRSPSRGCSIKTGISLSLPSQQKKEGKMRRETPLLLHRHHHHKWHHL
jgi:hypothetical protein